MKVIKSLPYEMVFTADGITLFDGRDVVGHRVVRKNDSEIEIAEQMIDKHLHGNAYNNWLKIVKIVYQVNKSIKKMMSDELWIEYLKSDDAKALNELKKQVLDTSLNELWAVK